jgi:isopentenyl diphosphate isomerase/L-lactate dehydrogenase-like FMN-dependent dehydrogenase
MTVQELYKAGKEKLAETKQDFMLRGVETEFNLDHNERVLKHYLFLQKALKQIDSVSTRTQLLDTLLEVPIVMSSLNAPLPSVAEDGLLKTARALKTAGSMMWLGSPVPKPGTIEALVKTGVPLCQTMKPIEDREKLVNTLVQAAEIGVQWVGVEVDAGQCTKIHDKMMTTGCKPMSVEELAEVKHTVRRPFVLKGILSPWDAERALEAGADLIVVSNHGVHTIDYLPHPFEVMDEIIRVVRGQAAVVVDSGFRRGTDVLKGLAMGADAVGLGRPIIWALAANGEEGVRDLIEGLKAELIRVMTMTGIEEPAQAHRGILFKSDMV